MLQRLRNIKWLCLLCVIILLTGKIELDVYADEKITDAQKLVDDISIGWNLGKSLNCIDEKSDIKRSVAEYETLWHNPVTTREMINTVAQAGFRAVRIPVAYVNHMDKDGKIDEEWLARVKEVTDYVLSEGMYAILTVYDTGKSNNALIQANMNNIEMYGAYAVIIWQQISEYFKDYDSRLIFESYNEVVDMQADNPWYGNKTSWQAMNYLNQLFVNVVRMSGGNNIDRFLIVNTYGAQATYGPLNDFEMPQDIVSNHLIVGIHTYHTSDAGIESVYKCINKCIVQRGYPCIIGEFGYNCSNKNSMQNIQKMISMYKSLGAACLWWDDGGNYKLLNRKNNEWYYPQIVQSMMQLVSHNW